MGNESAWCASRLHASPIVSCPANTLRAATTVHKSSWPRVTVPFVAVSSTRSKRAHSRVPFLVLENGISCRIDDDKRAEVKWEEEVHEMMLEAKKEEEIIQV